MNRFAQIIEREPCAVFAAFLALHFAVWTALPAALYPNLPLDLIEALTYGREWQLGYDKLPPLPWWLVEIVRRLFGPDLFYYALAQITVIGAFALVWAMARRVVGPPGATYLFIGSYYGDIYRCPVADSGSVHCTQLASQSGQRHPAGMVVANGYLWVALEHGGEFGNGLLWRCGLWTNDDCQVFDDPKGPDLLSLEVGGGYLWVGRSDGVIWRCDMTAANRCAVWDTAEGSIEALSYDGAGTLYAAVSSPEKPGAVV